MMGILKYRIKRDKFRKSTSVDCNKILLISYTSFQHKTVIFCSFIIKLISVCTLVLSITVFFHSRSTITLNSNPILQKNNKIFIRYSVKVKKNIYI